MTRKDNSKERRSCCPLPSNRQKRKAATAAATKFRENFPAGLAQPALRALAAAGYSSIDELAKVREEDLMALHGMGPKAFETIRAALKSRGQAFLT
jgi:hypothetical protein